MNAQLYQIRWDKHDMHLSPEEELEDIIARKAGIKCTVEVKQKQISIRTRDYADFLLAKSAIKGRCSKEICRDLKTLEVVK